MLCAIIQEVAGLILDLPLKTAGNIVLKLFQITGAFSMALHIQLSPISNGVMGIFRFDQ